MTYSYDRTADSPRLKTGVLTLSERKLWKAVEEFLYPPWYKGSGYRGDLKYTVYVRLLQEFYQDPEGMSEDNKESVPDALARVKAENDKEWKNRRQDALEVIRELPDPTHFSESDVRRHVYRSTLDRLVYEGALKRRGGGFFSLAGPFNRTAAFLVDKLSVDIDVNLYPEKLSWAGEGKVTMKGSAEFVLPGHKYKSEPYELEVLEDGTAKSCKCPDPLHHHLIWMAAKARKRDLAELIEDQKDRGSLRNR